MKIENIKEFTERTGKSKSSVYRFYKKNIELWNETKMRNNKRVFPVNHARYFDSEIMFDENKVLRQENNSMRNLIDCLMDKKSLPSTLWYMDWSFFVTIAYKSERNKKSCFKMMNAFYENIILKYGENSEVRIFFTTEPFSDRNGYHNHFVMYISDKKLHEQVIEEMTSFFIFDKIDIGLYNHYKPCLFYTVKKGLVNEDWDLLGNKLENNIVAID